MLYTITYVVWFHISVKLTLPINYISNIDTFSHFNIYKPMVVSNAICHEKFSFVSVINLNYHIFHFMLDAKITNILIYFEI